MVVTIDLKANSWFNCCSGVFFKRKGLIMKVVFSQPASKIRFGEGREGGLAHSGKTSIASLSVSPQVGQSQERGSIVTPLLNLLEKWAKSTGPGKTWAPGKKH
jgi:hypothetical protein